MEALEERMEEWMESQLPDLSNRRWLGFSRMDSKGSRFILGVSGRSLDVAFASATVRTCSQPSAKFVRKCPREVAIALPMGRAAKVITFGGFNVCVRSFSAAVTFSMFHNVSKVVLCERRTTFASFSEDELHIFGDIHRHFAW